MKARTMPPATIRATLFASLLLVLIAACDEPVSAAADAIDYPDIDECDVSVASLEGASCEEPPGQQLACMSRRAEEVVQCCSYVVCGCGQAGGTQDLTWICTNGGCDVPSRGACLEYCEVAITDPRCELDREPIVP